MWPIELLQERQSSAFSFFSPLFVFTFQALPFALSFCNPDAKSRADAHSCNNSMKFLMKFFMELIAFKYISQK
jgi:hypothetical protein